MHRVSLRTGLALVASLLACSSEQPTTRLGCVGDACSPDVASGAGGVSGRAAQAGPGGAPAGGAGQGGVAGTYGTSGRSGAPQAGATSSAGSSAASGASGGLASGAAGGPASGASGATGVAGVSAAAGSPAVAGAGGQPAAPAEVCTEGRPCADATTCAAGETCEAGVCTGKTSPSCGPVVHEWGTYTSVVASDGHTLGGLHHVDEPLPTWVYRRDSYIEKGVESLPEEPRQQLETPVLYFHTGQAMKIDVDVSFPEGVVGEWFPVDRGDFLPLFGLMKHLAGGSMHWDLRLDPGLDPATYPPVTPDEIWAPSRHVASTPVSTIDGSQHEQFLFYRGLGTFVPSFTVRADGDGGVHLHNDSTDPIGAVFVLRATATEGSFVSLGALAAGGDLVSPVPAATVPRAALVEAARAGLRESLVGTGLYADEALAMVDTWTRSWFNGTGTRVLYIAPRSWTNAWLPTTVLPTPSEFVRTLVGRVEVMTPAEEAALVHQLQLSTPTKTPLPADLLGRFAESRLERAVELLAGEPAQLYADDLRKLAHGSSFYQ